MHRESLKFGSGSFVGAIMADPNFFEAPTRDQARILGWVAGCPIVEELTDPDNPAPGRGLDAMIERYGQVAFWFGVITHEVAQLNPKLAEQLTAPVERKPDEPAGKYEPESIPENYLSVIPPMETLAGYGLPRLFLEQAGIGKGLSPKEVRKRTVIAHASLKHAATQATTPSEFIALVAEDAAMSDVEPKRALYHVLPKGWMSEHNGTGMVHEVKAALEEYAPGLWSIYSNLTEAEKTDLKLV